MARSKDKRRKGPRFAVPTSGLVKGSPERGKFAPWYLKRWGSRPLYGRREAVVW